jgi:hypothetical protein
MEKFRSALKMELALCESKRDVRKVFDAAEDSVRVKHIPVRDWQELLKEIDRRLPALLPKEKQPILVEEARSQIRNILTHSSFGGLL